MTTITKSVYSSHISALSYDTVTHDLEVLWDTGKTSVYEKVPRDMADKAMNAWSVGTFIREEIKPNFRHHYK